MSDITVRADDVMRKFGWLSRQPERLRAEVLARSSRLHVKAGSIIYRTGEQCYAIYGLVDGVIDLHFANGRVGSTRTPGYWIGEAAAFLGAARHASIVAKTDVEVLCLPRADFEHLIADAEFCRCFASLTAEHLAEALGIIESLLEHDPMVRMCGRLLNLSRAQTHANTPLRLTQSELASMCGLTRQTVGKVLKQLVRDGVVSSGYGELRILDASRLSSFAH